VVCFDAQVNRWMRQGVNARGRYLQQGERSRGGLPFMIIRMKELGCHGASGARKMNQFEPRRTRTASTGYSWGWVRRKGGAGSRDLRCCAIVRFLLAGPCCRSNCRDSLARSRSLRRDARMGLCCQISNGRQPIGRLAFWANKKDVRIGRGRCLYRTLGSALLRGERG
jgi:hypothetical protein